MDHLIFLLHGKLQFYESLCLSPDQTGIIYNTGRSLNI